MRDKAGWLYSADTCLLLCWREEVELWEPPKPLGIST